VTRPGSLEPRLIRKGQRRLDGIDKIVIGLYARGMTVSDIGAAPYPPVRDARGLRARGIRLGCGGSSRPARPARTHDSVVAGPQTSCASRRSDADDSA
jgi:hypothetical protein